jgi:hypothetical protein
MGVLVVLVLPDPVLLVRVVVVPGVHWVQFLRMAPLALLHLHINDLWICLQICSILSTPKFPPTHYRVVDKTGILPQGTARLVVRVEVQEEEEDIIRTIILIIKITVIY